MAENEIIYRHGDRIPIFNSWYELDFENAPEVLEGTDDPGACLVSLPSSGEIVKKIYIRLDRGNPKETLPHEIGEAHKYELLEVAQNAMDELLHTEGGE